MMNKRARALLSLIFLTGFWLYSFNVFGSEKSVYAPLFLVPGMLTNLIGSGSEKEKKRVLLPAILSFISFVLIPYPYNAGLLFLFIGFLFAIFRPRSGVSRGILITGFLLVIQAAVMALYLKVIPSMHDASFLSYAVYPFVKLFSPPALSNGVIYVQQGGQLFPFNVTWDKLGIYPFVLIFFPALAISLLTSKKRVKESAGLLISGFIYLIIRYAFLIGMFFNVDVSHSATAFERMGIFFSPGYLLVSFIPFIVWMAIRSSLYPSQILELPELKIKENIIPMVLAFLIGFFLLGAIIYQDPGAEKEGRVLIDEIHSIWEPSTLKMDTEWYGTGSTYNAYSLVEWLDYSYKVDRIVSPSYLSWNPGPNIKKVEPDVISDEITSEILENYDILILKTPSPYSGREVKAIVDWVENGGGLFMIGDHSDFAGSSTSLNELGFVEFEFNGVNAATGSLSIYERGNFHPCVRYMPEFHFLTSCSIKAPLTAERVIPGYGLLAEPGEFASTGFFRETLPESSTRVTDLDYGIFHQCVALKYGKGRVVAFADSTTISNFRAFFGGTPELTIGCMEYLNHANRYNWINTALEASGALSIFIFIFIFLLRMKDRDKNRKMVAMMIALCLLPMGVGTSLVVFREPVYDSLPARYYDWNNTIAFYSYHSADLDDYETFFIWTQRVDLIPVRAPLEECFDKGKITVVIDPVKDFSAEEIYQIKRYVGNGGSFLFMMNDKSFGMDLLADFGLGIKYQIADEDETTNEAEPIPENGPSVIGGKPLKSVGNRTVLSEVDYGKGKFIVFTSSKAFMDGFNGNPGWFGYDITVPDDQLRALYSLEYEILEKLRS
ncbi:MAG: hypothetical protein SVE93_07065 [Candidatus Thermoplasmatota archaeon]|nr:hypothetical protein [Candidatus Thermoplasmatota archaeon]